MRVTIILPFADLSGGIRVPAIYAQKLVARGHHVEVVSVPQRTPTLFQGVRSVLKGRGWPQKWRTESHFDGLGIPHKVIESARPIADRDVPDADVVVGTWWETLEWVAKMHPRKGAKVSFIQGYDPTFYEDRPQMETRVFATWGLPAHKVIVSRWLMDLARDRFGDVSASHVPNSVDTQQFWAEPRGRQPVPTIGLQYSLPRCKGLDVALRAINLAAEKIPNLCVRAFGRDEPGGAHPPLLAGAKYALRPKQESIREVYASCDVWLCGSRCEGFHLPPLEAMACRCPVVSTKVGGPMDMIEESVNGHLVEIEDSEALADRLVRVLSQPEPTWKTMSDAAWETAHRYTWDNAADLFEAALHTAVERNGRGELRQESRAREVGV